MEGLDKRAPFTATGGIIPPEFRNIKTPCYILDEKALIKNAKLLGEVAERTGCKMLLAQKAFSNYDCYQFFEPYLAGTEASGLFEARLGAEEMPEKEVHVFCAGYRADEFEELLQYADHIVFNSPTQLLRFGPGAKEAGKSVGLRINPECSTQDGHEIYDPCAPGSRMGTTRAQWDEAFQKNPELLDLLDVLHFHTLCEQNSDDLETTLKAVEEKFGKYLKLPNIKWLNMGGGHHITRNDYDIDRLERCIRHMQETYDVTVYVEPGEAVALNAGYLVTEVMDIVDNGIRTLILDASAACHMPDVLEMPYRPPLKDSGEADEKQYTYRLSSMTCLAGDVIGDYSFDHEIRIGDRLYFEDMAIYSMVKNNTFNGMCLPSIARMDENGECSVVKTFGYEEFVRRLG